MKNFKTILIKFFPDILSILIFISGALLVFSNSLKFEESHINLINKLLPGDIIALSHLSASITGTFLLILSYGISRRLDSAYYFSILTIVLAIFFSFFRGFDYFQAIFLGFILLLLIPTKDRFYRKSSLIQDKLSKGWIFAMLSVVTISIFLGIYTFKTSEYKNEVWWYLAVNKSYPIFLRASFTTIFILLIFFILRLLNDSRIIDEISSDEVLNDIESILETSDKSASFLALLSDKLIFFNDNQDSMVMFGQTQHNLISMGDPIGNTDSFSEIILNFYQKAKTSGKNVVFYEISKDFLSEYLDIGLKIIKIGEEAVINLDTYDLQTPRYKKIRYTFNKFEKLNLRFEVVDDISNIIDELEEVSNSWLENKKTKEKSFSLGNFDVEYLRNFKTALLYQDDKIIAFSNLMATKDMNEISIDLMRYLDSAPSGTMEYLFVKIINWSKNENYKRFSLGMAPLAGIHGDDLSPIWNRISVFLFNHGGNFYNFEGLRQFKNKFSPDWESKYLAYSGHFNLASILKDTAFLISGGFKGIFIKK